ncbi:hypothetical protein CCB80_08105 [Armatimonadetes bacterium Uphvl-Ar1]|nr:hypothetical protein CCB80_08105 [Armatimonadetes bacterium Uphvl-Ar1]
MKWILLGLALLTQMALAQGGSIAGQGNSIGSEPAVGDTQTYNLILTPGQKGELPIEAEPNDVIIADVNSQSFDPAVELVDESGKVLATNDDIANGNQSARILKRLPVKGKFKILVSGFKGAAGGSFSLTVRKFNAPLMASSSESSRFARDTATWRAVLIKKDVPTVISYFNASRTVPTGFDSNGLPLNNRPDSRLVPSGGRFTVTSPIDQEIYVLIPQSGWENFTLDALPVEVRDISIGSTSEGSLPRSQSISYRFRAEAGALLRSIAGSRSTKFNVSLRPIQFDNPDQAMPPTFLPAQSKNTNLSTFFIHHSGTYEAVVSHDEQAPQPIEFQVINFARPWTTNSISESLPIGENLYYRWTLPIGVLLDLTAVSNTFDADITLYSPEGFVIADEDDQSDSLNPSHQRLITQPGDYIVRIGSHGNGGGGEFTLTQSITRPTAFSSGTEFGVLTAKPELQLISATAGEFFYLTLESSNPNTAIQIFQPNGEQLQTTTITEPTGRRLILVNPRASGDHLILISSRESNAQVKLTKVKIGSLSEFADLPPPSQTSSH